MVCVVRMWFGGARSVAGIYLPAANTLEGCLQWNPLPLSVDAIMLLAVSAFGDLASYRALSQGSCFWYQKLQMSLLCIREWERELTRRLGLL